MTNLLEKSRYIVLIGIIALVVSSLSAFAWSAAKALDALGLIITSFGQDSHIAIALVGIVDGVLIASVLLVVATSLHEIFISPLNVPRGMVAHDLNELKSKLSSLIVLVMSLKFLEHLVEWSQATETLFYGLAVAVVSAALIALSYLGIRE
jgi:uncharacterized membrane protein YqhA